MDIPLRSTIHWNWSFGVTTIKVQPFGMVENNGWFLQRKINDFSVSPEPIFKGMWGFDGALTPWCCNNGLKHTDMNHPMYCNETFRKEMFNLKNIFTLQKFSYKTDPHEIYKISSSATERNVAPVPGTCGIPKYSMTSVVLGLLSFSLSVLPSYPYSSSDVTTFKISVLKDSKMSRKQFISLHSTLQVKVMHQVLLICSSLCTTQRPSKWERGCFKAEGF